MRKIYFLTTVLFLTQYCLAQTDIDLDPTNYTSFEIRKKANDGKSTKVTPNINSSVQYIQPNSQIRLIFDKKKVLEHKAEIKIRVSATLINSKGDEKPIEVLGYVSVKKTEKTKINPSDPILFDYNVTNTEVDADKLQNTEVDISSEKLEVGDKIIIRIENTKSNTGFVMVFEVDNLGINNDNNLDPTNYTSFEVRRRANDGKSTKVTPSIYSSVQYIQPNSQVRLIFDKKKILEYKAEIKIRVSATLINSKGDEKPIEVLGYVSVKKTQKTKTNSSDPTLFDYNVINTEVDADKLQNTEVDISSEKLEEGDKIKIRIENIKSNTGFVMVFEVDDFGIKTGPSSGFAWLKTQANKNINFQASPWLGYSFYYRPNKGASFWGKVFSPTIGPEASVVQVGSTVYIGLGGQISLLANTVKFSYGQLLGYPDKGGYLSIGLNFVNSIETLTNLVKSK